MKLKLDCEPSGPSHKTLLFVQPRHTKLYCLCNRDIRNFIVCAIEPFETLLFACPFWGSVERRLREYKSTLIDKGLNYFISVKLLILETIVRPDQKMMQLIVKIVSRSTDQRVVCTKKSFDSN